MTNDGTLHDLPFAGIPRKPGQAAAEQLLCKGAEDSPRGTANTEGCCREEPGCGPGSCQAG